MAGPRFLYNRLNRSLSSLVTGRLWLQVVIALIFGAVTGALLGPDLELISRQTAGLIGQWLALPGRIFLAVIQMIIVPLVASSIVLGMAAAGTGTDLKRVGRRFAFFVMATTLIGAAIGGSLATFFDVGSRMQAVMQTESNLAIVEVIDQSELADESPAILEIGSQLPDLLTNLVPQNITQSILNQDMLAIVVFALLIGLAVVAADKKELTKPLVSLAEATLEICMTIIRYVMHFAPIAVFGLIAETTLENGARTLIDLAQYMAVVIAGLILLLILYILIVSLFGKIRPLTFLRAAAPVQLLAFSTSSSAAVMPLTMKTSIEKLGVNASLAGAVIPLAATVNMAGTALYQSAAIVFLANVAGLNLSLAELTMIMITLTGASIGAPAAPGASVAVLSATAASFGIPASGLAMVLGVDRLLDMIRTSVNVTGDMVLSRLLSISQPDQPIAPAHVSGEDTAPGTNSADL